MPRGLSPRRVHVQPNDAALPPLRPPSSAEVTTYHPTVAIRGRNVGCVGGPTRGGSTGSSPQPDQRADRRQPLIRDDVTEFPAECTHVHCYYLGPSPLELTAPRTQESTGRVARRDKGYPFAKGLGHRPLDANSLSRAWWSRTLRVEGRSPGRSNVNPPPS